MPPLPARPHALGETRLAACGQQASGGAASHTLHGPTSPDEVSIALALTTRWMLATGRCLDQSPLMHDLTGDQLIDFWADDHIGGTRSASKTQGKAGMCNDPAAMPQHPSASSRPADRQSVHRPMVAVDIVSFGNRTPDVQNHIHDTLYRIMEDTCDVGGVPWKECHHEDRGDGILLAAPAHTGIEALFEIATIQLPAGLRNYNKMAAPAAQIRLRVALHAGYININNNGVRGKAVIQLFRMLDAPRLKAEVGTHGADLSLIVSESLYHEVIKYSAGPISPDSFRPIVVKLKEANYRGWLWLSPTTPVADSPHRPPHPRTYHRTKSFSPDPR
jgi:hypothetical protein